MTRQQLILALPQPLRWAVQVVAPTGLHRARPHGAVVGQRFVHCPTCGVDTAATIHGQLVLCTEGHTVTTGGNQ